jgi:predicted aspartyl protease
MRARAIALLLPILLVLGACSHAVRTTAAGELQLFEVHTGGTTLWFLIDSGSSYTFLDARAAERLHLATHPGTAVRGAGGGAVPTQVVDRMTFRIDGLQLTMDDVRITDLSAIAAMIGHPLDGFFGYPLLAQFAVTFDPDAQKITFARSARVGPKDVAVPIRFGGTNRRWIYVPASVKFAGVEEVTSEFFVDSGSSDAVNHPLLRQSSGPLRTISVGNGLGAAGGEGVAGRAEQLRFGTLVARDLPSNCCGTLPGTERQLGAGALSRFIVTFDYPHARMIFGPRATAR